MPISLQQFVKHLADSGLMSEEEILDAQEGVPAEKLTPDDAQPFAKELVKQQKLTAYQATAIYQGKPHGLSFGNYVVFDKLGQGGMGMVFKAEHRRMKRVVALKVMSAAGMKSPDAVKRFRREVEAAAKLTHPNIVASFDADEAKGMHFLVMEYVEGDDLAKLVKKNGPLPVDRAIQYIIQAARGLQHAHSEGVVHRDIKPANLLLDKNGTVKILDMGLARIDDAVGGAQATGLTQTGNIMGTVDYMSPEQALNTKNADRPADIYSLGCSLWYLLTGKSVFAGESLMEKLMAHREQPIPSLSGSISMDKSIGGNEALDSVFGKMIAKSPEERYQTMAEVIHDLEAVLAGGQVAASTSAAWGAGGSVSLGGRTQGGTAAEQDSALQEFLRAIGPGASGSDVRTRPRPGSETLVAKAGEKAQVSVLQSGLQQMARLPPKTRWSIAGGAGVLVLVLLVLMFRGGGDTVESAAPATADTAAKRSKPAEGAKKEKTVAKAVPALDGQIVAGDWITLFNGSNLKDWQKTDGSAAGWKVENGYMEIVPGTGSIRSVKEFGPDYELHAEFWLPLMADKAGQQRANSGIYLSGRHEIQILDMFNNPSVPAINGCGALYGVLEPKAGGILPPETWQSFDITYKSPRYDGRKLTAPGRLSLVHNGAKVIDDAPFDVEKSMGAIMTSVGETGPIVLQDHGMAGVRFRNLRLRPIGSTGSNAALPEQSASKPDGLADRTALDFSAQGRVDVPSLKFDGTKSLTIEAWIKHGKLTKDGLIAHLGPFVLKYHAPLGRYEFLAVDQTMKRSVNRMTEYNHPVENRWFHIAGQWDGTTLELFVDGQPQLKLLGDKQFPKPLSPQDVRTAVRGWINDGKSSPLSIGSIRPEYAGYSPQCFAGQIAALRVSSVVRYEKRFNPAVDAPFQLPRDNDTLALYHFDEGTGDKLGDSSGNNRHGKITGAKWVGGSSQSTLAAAADWVDLFNGRDLTGWDQQGFNGWSVKNGVLVGETTAGKTGWLMSKNEYADFELTLEYKISAGSNSGVFLRAPPQGEVSGSQFTEVQILDDDAPEFSKTGPGGKTGAVWNQIPANPLAKAPADAWNRMEIAVRGKHVKVTVNGVVTAEGNPQRLGDTAGRIGLQLYPSRLEFRNIRVRDLSRKGANAVELDRGAAEWALGCGGKVVIKVGERERPATAIKDLPLLPFALIRIDLTGCGERVTDDGLRCLTGLSQFTHLYLARTDVTDAGLEHVKGLTSLVDVYLGDTSVTDAGLANLKGLTNLKQLALLRTRVTDQGLEHLQGLTQLTYLDIGNNTPVTDAGLKQLKGLMRLERLDLTGTGLTNAGLEHLKGMVRLTHLDVNGTQVTDVGLENIKGLERLTSLGLSYTPVSNVGLEKLQGLVKLATLGLAQTQVTVSGLKTLRNLPELTVLGLNASLVTDAGLEQLQKLPKLAELRLFMNKQTFTPDLAEKLKKNLPNCKIVR